MGADEAVREFGQLADIQEVIAVELISLFPFATAGLEAAADGDVVPLAVFRFVLPTTARMLPEWNSLMGLFAGAACLDLVAAVAICLFPLVRVVTCLFGTLLQKAITTNKETNSASSGSERQDGAVT